MQKNGKLIKDSSNDMLSHTGRYSCFMFIKKKPHNILTTTCEEKKKSSCNKEMYNDYCDKQGGNYD